MLRSPRGGAGSWPRAWTRLVAGAAVALLPAVAPAAAQTQPTEPTIPGHFAITHARVVRVSGPTLESGTVVVRDGIIEAVGADAAVPKDAWVIDGTGLTVYPGLIDPLTTLGHAEPRPAAPAARGPGGGGGAGASSPEIPYSWGPEDRPATFTWLSGADELDPTDGRIAKWRDAGYTSALSTRSRGIFPGAGAVVDLSGERGGDMVVKPDVVQRINLDARGFPGYPNSLMGVFAYIKQLYLDAQHYDRVWQAYDRSPRGRARPEYDRALEPLRAPQPVLFPAADRKEVERAIKTAKVIGEPLVVYGAQAAYDAADVLKAAGAPVLVDLDWPEPSRDADPADEPALSQLRLYERAPTTPAALQKAGVRFAFYTGGLDDPGQARARVKRAVDAGLPEDAAIRALTLAPAQILGLEDRMGSIDAGKIANLVVVRGDLLDPQAKIEKVVVDGHPYDVFHAETLARGGARGSAPDAGADGARRAEPAGAPADSAAPAPAAGPGTLVPMAADRGPYREDAVTLIRNATVMTVTKGTLQGADVLIRNGRIAEVGKGIAAPNGAHVIDATGLYLTPGIIDCHSHIATDAVNEGSINVSAMVGIKDVLDPSDVAIYRALAGGVTTINVLHGSANPIGGGNAVIKLRWGADADDLLLQGAPPGIKFALGENVKRDRNPDRYPATRMGVQDVIRQAFIDARAYQKEWDAYRARAKEDRDAIPPRRDLKLEKLAQVLSGERLVHAHSYRADEILQLMRTAEEFGVRIATFQHVLEGYKVADELARHGAGASTFSDWWAYKVEAYDAIPYNAALMTRHGVVVSINSDDPEEMRHLNQEAGKTMKWGGLSENEALKLVTINPAMQLGIADRVGSIEVGKDADLALFDGDPLTVDGRVQKTFIDGKLYFDRDLDRERTAAIEREKAALLEKFGPAARRAPVTTQQATTPNPEVQR